MSESSQIKATDEKRVMQMQRPFSTVINLILQMNSIFIVNSICKQKNEMKMIKK